MVYYVRTIDARDKLVGQSDVAYDFFIEKNTKIMRAGLYRHSFLSDKLYLWVQLHNKKQYSLSHVLFFRKFLNNFVDPFYATIKKNSPRDQRFASVMGFKLDEKATLEYNEPDLLIYKRDPQ